MINWNEYIISDPSILFGKPIFKGTRIPVDLILEKLSNGESFNSIKVDYPTLTEGMLYAGLAFASRLMNMSQSFEMPA